MDYRFDEICKLITKFEKYEKLWDARLDATGLDIEKLMGEIAEHEDGSIGSGRLNYWVEDDYKKLYEMLLYIDEVIGERIDEYSDLRFRIRSLFSHKDNGGE